MSLASRGVLLLLIVTLTASAPYAFVVMRRDAVHRRLAADGAAALLACCLDQNLKSGRLPGAATQPWLGGLAAHSARLRFAAALRPDGTVVEFVRRVAIPQADIIRHVAGGAQPAALRPLRLTAGSDGVLHLVSIPAGDAVLVGLLEGPDAQPVGEFAASAALLGGPALAALIGLIGFRMAVLRPLRRIGACVQGVESALREASGAGELPAELAALAERVQETEQALLHWRGEAGALRQSLEHRLAARTATVTRALRRAERAADTDALTGLVNRRVLERSLPPLVDAQRAAGEDLSILWIDIDHFKDFNDARGHLAGDELVRAAAGLARSAAHRERDLAARYGGDEFVIVLPGAGVTAAADVAARLVRLFSQHVRTLGELAARPGLSIGIASLGDAPISVADLLRRADGAMYAAKRAGVGVLIADAACDAGADAARIRS
jgi:diguanylate cyclase (GGDEF)-like protein